MRSIVAFDLRISADSDDGSAADVSADSSLQVTRRTLRAGESVAWLDAHPDEVLWVRRGGLRESDGAWNCQAGDVVVVEEDVALNLISDNGADVVIFGARQVQPWGLLGPPDGPRSAYVLPRAARASVSTEIDPGVTVSTSFWADSTRPSSRVAMLEVAGSAGHHAPSHSHSRDEIIYVVDGELRIGSEVIGADMAVFIPADQRYRFSAPEAYSFINFRADASEITMKPGSAPLLETAAGLVGTAAL